MIWSLSRLKPRFAAALALLLSAGLISMVVLAAVTLHFHIGFAIPILLCAWTRSRRFLWSLTVVLACITIAKIIWGGRPPGPYLLWVFVTNRVIAVITLLMCAGVAHLLIGLIEWTENEHQRL